MRLAQLFGRKPFSTLRSEACALWDKKEFGLAKLAFERAFDAKGATAAQRAEMDEKVGQCCDAIATERLAEAERLRESGEMSLAEDELRHALETARCADLKRRIANALEQGQKSEVREQVEAVEAVDDEARYMALGGTWESAQAVEYESYGERFRQAILQLHDGQLEIAAGELENILAEVTDAHFLWFEVGRARLSNGDRLGAFEAMGTFLKGIGPEGAGDAQLGAHMALAAIAAEHDDFERAMDHYGQAMEAMPEDPRTYLAMGSFMRQHGLADEATDVLTSGLAVLPDERPHVHLWTELGLACGDVGRSEEAIHWLEQVVEFFTVRNHVDLPPESTLRLSRLHEEAGNLVRAADLLRLLTEGTDVDNLFAYHLDTARLLGKLAALDEAKRMLARAAELLPDDEEAKSALESISAQIITVPA